MKDVVTIGEILIDLTYSGRENGIPVYKANPGGAPANVAVAAARLGADTAFIGKVGADYYGDFLRKTMQDNGVDVAGMLTDTGAGTTLAVVSLSDSGERSFSFYRKNCADTLLDSSEVSLDLLGDTKFLHFGSVSLTDEPSRSATLFAAQKAKELGATVTYDPNYREALWNSEAEAVEQMKSVLGMVDILKISDEELPLLTGTSDAEAGTKLLHDTYGIPLILLTLGADGAFYRRDDENGNGSRQGDASVFYGKLRESFEPLRTRTESKRNPRRGKRRHCLRDRRKPAGNHLHLRRKRSGQPGDPDSGRAGQEKRKKAPDLHRF